MATATSANSNSNNNLTASLDEIKKITETSTAVIPEIYSLHYIYEHLIKNVNNIKDAEALTTQLNELSTSFQEYIIKEKAGRELWGDVLWKTKRLSILSHYRYHWEQTFEKVKELGQQTYTSWDISLTRNTFTTIPEQDNDLAFSFWDSLSTSSTTKQPLIISWGDFQTKYQRRFGKWNESMTEALDHLTTNNSAFPTKSTSPDHVTVFDFIAVVNDYGFPFNLEQLPIMAGPPPSELARIETAKLLTDLMVYFSSLEMREHLIILYTYFKDVNRKDKDAMIEKANVWAKVVLSSRGKDKSEFTEEQKEADQVDLARRTISLFYQRYMVLWRTGQYARDLFNDVDFPGKARVYEVRDYVLPLDHANYHIVIKGDSTKWESKRPKVYKFLDQLVKL